jgi:hypothetical protein
MAGACRDLVDDDLIDACQRVAGRLDDRRAARRSAS